jgi:cytochrome c
MRKVNTAITAVLCAGAVSWMTGFVADHLVSPKELTENAVKIEVADTAPVAEAAAAPAGDVAAAPAEAAATAGPSVLAMVATADVEQGKKVAKACLACHKFEKGAPNGVGPNQWGLIGRKKESVEGFKYSGTLSAQGGDTWTYAELNKFLEKPKAYAPKTKMAYAGVKKPEDRAALLAYMRTMADAPAPLPTDAEIAAGK